jgi:uncharacterized membrane protein
MSFYTQRVERDLARWQAEGWVSDAGAASIRADLAARPAAFGAAAIFAVLGAVLFGFAIMSFVAAHWTTMSKLARLALLLATLWACYGAAAVLFSRRHDNFAHAAVLAGITVYGASIMLIAQMYHIDGNPPDAVLWWALGALLAAALAQSNPALASAFVLITVWTAWERMFAQEPHWTFLLVWAAAVAVTFWLHWRPGLHLATLSLIAWLIPLGFLVLNRHAHWLVALIGTGAALVAAFAGPAIDRRLRSAQALFTYGVATAFIALFIAQFIDDYSFFHTERRRTLGLLLLLAVVTLIGLLAAMAWALNTDNRPALWVGYAGFAAEIYALYWYTLGSMLETSLFFLVAAILVSALAWLAYLLHRRKATQAPA